MTHVLADAGNQTTISVVQNGLSTLIGNVVVGKRTSIEIPGGLPGPPGSPGPAGEGYQDPGDLVLIFENHLL